MFNQLASVDAEHHHRDVLQKQYLHSDSNAWLLGSIRTPTQDGHKDYLSWRDDWDPVGISTQPPDLLWLTGLPEVGKTVAVALVVKQLRDLRAQFRNSRTGICFSYLRMVPPQVGPRGKTNQVMRILLRRLVADLPSIPTEVEELYKDPAVPSPSDDKVLECLKTVCRKYHKKVFVAIDGLDECTEEERTILIRSLKCMPSNTKVLVASRYLPAIEESLGTSLRVDVFPHRRDVHLYLEEMMNNNPRFKRLMSTGTEQKQTQLRSQVENAVLSANGDS